MEESPSARKLFANMSLQDNLNGTNSKRPGNTSNILAEASTAQIVKEFQAMVNDIKGIGEEEREDLGDAEGLKIEIDGLPLASRMQLWRGLKKILLEEKLQKQLHDMSTHLKGIMDTDNILHVMNGATSQSPAQRAAVDKIAGGMDSLSGTSDARKRKTAEAIMKLLK